jgi:hypothetical protein
MVLVSRIGTDPKATLTASFYLSLISVMSAGGNAPTGMQPLSIISLTAAKIIVSHETDIFIHPLSCLKKIFLRGYNHSTSLTYGKG